MTQLSKHQHKDDLFYAFRKKHKKYDRANFILGKDSG